MKIQKKSLIIFFGILGIFLTIWLWSYLFSSRIKKISQEFTLEKEKVSEEKPLKENLSQLKEALKELENLLKSGQEFEIEK